MKGRPGEQGTSLGLERGLQLLFEQPHHSLDYSLAHFEGNITCESITDDYIGLPRVHIAPLDIADEIEAGVLQKLERLFGQVISLDLFFAYRQKPNPRISDADNNSRI